MATGSKNYSEVGDIKRWKGSNRWRYSWTNNCFVCVKIKSWYYHGKEQHQLYLLIFRTIYPSTCGDLRGTSAGFTPVDPGRQFVDYFSTDICRFYLHLLTQCSNLITVWTKKNLHQADSVSTRDWRYGRGCQGNKICPQCHRHIWWDLKSV